jgi:hypothetical protein
MYPYRIFHDAASCANILTATWHLHRMIAKCGNTQTNKKVPLKAGAPSWSLGRVFELLPFAWSRRTASFLSIRLHTARLAPSTGLRAGIRSETTIATAAFTTNAISPM